MKHIVVASQNPVKLDATQKAFTQMFSDETFTIAGVSVSSGVGDQPMNASETLTGAKNRAIRAQEAKPEADYWVGIEGGVEDMEGGMESFAFIYIISNEQVGVSRTGTYLVPPGVAELVRQGNELGTADDIFFGQTNSKQKNDSVGTMTHGVIDRTAYYVHAIVLALVTCKNPELY